MLFNFVPVIGSIVASIPAILLALMNLDITSTIWVIVLYMVINISISNILEPKRIVTGKRYNIKIIT